MKIKLLHLSALGFALLLGLPPTQAQQTDKQTDAKIKLLLKQLTLDEKITMLHADSKFGTGAVPRLHIPALLTDDGPLGVREEVDDHWAPRKLTTDSATFFPNGSAMAATWNPALALRYGRDLGEESRARKKDVILAPAFNIARTPLNGRTYEYLSEDPWLNSVLAVQTVKGIQQWHVAACIKHYAVNNQEADRYKVSAELSERALREIYLPAFKAAVEQADAWSLMSAYNKVRGSYCAENSYLLNDILKKEWGFKGVVISDWGGVHSTVNSALNGLDIEMGSPGSYDKYFFAAPLKTAVQEGIVPMKVVDDKIYRILNLLYHTALAIDTKKAQLNSPAHYKTAYDIASESVVLLKKDARLLPLNLSGVKSIAVIGDNATHHFQLEGYGAGVKAKYEVDILQGLKNRLPNVNITFARGYNGNYKANAPDSVKAATNKPNSKLIADAAAVAAKANLTILCIGGNRSYETENTDRKDLSIPFGEQELADAVLAANPNTIVVFTGGAPYDLGKLKQQAPALLWDWYNGSEHGNALADVLLGRINPSGKLPFTFPASLDDSPAHALHTYPGNNGIAEYKEGILVGYRWFDTKKIDPLYCFGYGLSYTTFSLSNLVTDKASYASTDVITASVTITNTGKTAGKEVVQLYVHKEGSAVERAEQELKSFQKVLVQAGKSVKVQLKIKASDLAYYNEKDKKWTVEPGKYVLMTGTSSRDVMRKVAVNVR